MPVSIDWFLTIPGILISIGVILLIVALVLFIISTLKEKKESVPSVLDENKGGVTALGIKNETTPVSTVEEVTTPIQDNSVTIGEQQPSEVVNQAPVTEAAPVQATIEPVQNNESAVSLESAPTIEPTPVQPTTSIETVQPVAQSQTEQPIENIPLIDTVSEEVTIPSFEGDEIASVDATIPADDTTEFVTEEPIVQVSEQQPIQPEVAPVVENTAEPIIPVVTEEETKTEEITKSMEFEIPNPIVEEQHPIYGGADPLEATQNLPKIDVHHEPYSGGNVEATVVDEPVNEVEETVPKMEEIVVEQMPAFEVNQEPAFNIEPEPMPELQSVEQNPQVVPIPEDEIESL